MRIGVEYGGDEFAQVTGPAGKTTKLVAGGLVAYDFGLLYHPPSAFALELTIGWKLEADRFDNGEITLQRFPVDVIGAWSRGDLRLGLGITVHIAPTIGCHLSGICDEDVSLGSAIGGIVQIAYAYYQHETAGADFAFRYTAIKYSRGDDALDASCLGLFIGAWY